MLPDESGRPFADFVANAPEDRHGRFMIGSARRRGVLEAAVYPLGMTAIGPGVTPDSGFTYANQLLFYSRDKSKADDGSTLPESRPRRIPIPQAELEEIWRRAYLESRLPRISL